MDVFKPGSLSVFHKLANEFCIADNWFCDLPGHTWPNRYFMHAATSLGCANNTHDPFKLKHNKAEPIYFLLEKHKIEWAMYSDPKWQNDSQWFPSISDMPQARLPIFEGPFIPARSFIGDCEKGTLPFYSFITVPGRCSMHPSQHVECGESFLAFIYNALRKSPCWNETLFIVNFDENGGIYDHTVPPPTEAPDDSKFNDKGDLTCKRSVMAPEFDFTLLGPRIPVLLISPWLKKGSVDGTQFQNTSILRFVEEFMESGKDKVHLTKRDLHAPSIAPALMAHWEEKPRTDCPADIRAPTSLNDCMSGTKKPKPDDIEYLEEYTSCLPGHPDSGKHITRNFRSMNDVSDYLQERYRAAREYFAAT